MENIFFPKRVKTTEGPVVHFESWRSSYSLKSSGVFRSEFNQYILPSVKINKKIIVNERIGYSKRERENSFRVHTLQTMLSFNIINTKIEQIVLF